MQPFHGRGARALSLIAAIGLAGTARATLVGGAPTLTDVTLATGNWPAGPAYVTTPASGLSVSSATTAQGNPTAAGSGAMTVLSETFTPGSSTTYGAPNNSGFVLGKIDVLAGGGGNGNVDSIHLFAITNAPSASASASYNDGTHTVGPDLLGGGSGLSFNWNPGAVASGHAWLTEFQLAGTDNVTLNSGTSYAVEIWSPNSTATPNQNNFIWYRNGSTPNDPGGQIFGAHNSDLTDSTNGKRLTIDQEGLAGGTPRTAALALYSVPEPASLAMIALASAGTMLRRRRA